MSLIKQSRYLRLDTILAYGRIENAFDRIF